MALILLSCSDECKRVRDGAAQVCRVSPRLLPVVLEEQRVPGSFVHAVHHLLDVLDISGFDAHYRNDDTGAPAHVPSMLLKAMRTRIDSDEGRQQVRPPLRHRRAGVRQPPPQQTTESLHLARSIQSRWSMETVRPRTQHREVGELPKSGMTLQKERVL